MIARTISAISEFPTTAPLGNPFRLLRLWLNVMRERRALAKMTTQQLTDLGLSRAEVLKQANRPFWEISDARKRQGC